MARVLMVYILKMQDTDYYKIGFTDGDVESRIDSLQTGNPHKLILVAIFRDASQLIEQNIQGRLSGFRTDGGSEWFYLSDEIINDLISRYQGEVESEEQNWTGYYREGSSAGGVYAHDVRPIRRDENDTSRRIKVLLHARWEDALHSSGQHIVIPVGKEHNLGRKTDGREGI